MDPDAASTSATERLAVFRARQQQHSPIKTRSRARKVLAERPTGNARASGTAGKVKEGRKLVKTTSDPGPSALTFPRASPSHFSIPPRDVLAPPLSPCKPGSPNKRPRSPDDENGRASPAKRLHASPGKPTLPSPSPIRSPPRHVQKLSFPTAFALSPPAMALPSDLEDPFSASPSPPTSDGKDRPLLLRTRSIEKDLPLMTAIVAANQPQIRIIDSPTPVLGLAPYPANSPSIPTFSLPAQVSPSPLSWSTIPSQSLLSPSQVSTPTPSFAIQASSVGPSLLAPAAEIVTRSSSSFKPRTSAPAMMQGGHAAFLASLSGEEISPRRGLQRSKSTSSLGDERIDPSLLLLTRPPSPAPPSPQHAAAPTPVVERKLPGFGSPQLSPILLGVPSPSRISTSHLSPTPLRRSPLSPAVQAVAARPSGIPRLAIIAATPARASPYAASPGPSPGPLTLRVPAEPDEDGASPVEKAAPPSTATAGMSSDMANRLAGLQSMMSSMGPSRRRSTGTNAPAVPPKTPLTGGHALRRRVSASAVPSPVPQVKRVPSNGAMRKVVSTNCAAEVMGSEGGAAALAATIAQPLRDVVAFVDVRTAEGDDASEVFVEMLRSLGARTVAKHSVYTTHVIFKSGRPQTLTRLRALAEPRPHCVGVGWVVKCREKGERLPEQDFVIELGKGKEPIFQKKRKSIEPRNVKPADQLAVAKPLAAVERAKRLSLAFAPKVGSPLSKRMMPSSDQPVPLTDEPTTLNDAILTVTIDDHDDDAMELLD